MTNLSERLARLPADRRAEFLARLRAELDAPARSGPRPRGSTGPAPLSYAQETLWFLDRLAPGQPTYNVPFSYRLRGPLDVDAFRRALATVVSRHETLRTYFADDADGPVQIAAPDAPVDLPVREVPGATVEERLAQARRIAAAQARTPFDLTRGPLLRAQLLRLDADDHVFLFNVHHIVFDGWSLGVFASELAECYAAEREGRAAKLEPMPIQYADFAAWQRESLRGEALDKLTAFWRETLADLPVLEFPTDRPRPAQMTYTGTFRRRRMAMDIHEGIRRLARAEAVTPYTVYMAAFFALLHRYTGQDDLVIGSPTANREHSQVEPLIGFFVNMLVLRLDASGDPTFRELVRRMSTVVNDAFAHGELPFEKLVGAVNPVRDPSRSPLFQVAYTFQNAGGAPMRLPDLAVEEELLDPGTSRFDMSWNLFEREDHLELNIEFNTDLFDVATIEQLMTHYERVMRAILAAPDTRLSEVDMLGAEERHALLHDFDGPRREVAPAVIPELFARQVERAPDAVALVVEGTEITYAELNRRSNRLAHALRAAGAGPDKLVAVALPRTADLVTAVLGALKAGAGYLPLDPGHPPARLADILQDAGPCAVVTHSAYADRLPDHPGLILLDRAGELLSAQPDTDPPTTVRPEDLAYVIYTSGSTGRPKGVQVEQRNVVNFVASVRELFDLTPADRVLGYASVTFDVSVFEMFSALLTGARLYLATDDERLSMDRLQKLMEDAGITVIDLPPTVMALLEPERFTALRIVFVGGEAFPGELVNRWNPNRRFFNGYGPTECTVTMIVQECTGRWDTSPPIGLPMANHVAHVVDRDLRPVPRGVPGELVIGGAGLARGYLNRPELTAEKFVADPFGTAPGGRLYRTGDLVKRLPDGRITFLGRIDRQVKIRGLRIELGEIQSVLAAHPAIGQATVEPWTDERGEKHLVGYVTPAAGGEVDLGALRSYLAERLPVYMVPAYFVALDELPLTPSGKVDVRALPAPDATRPIGERTPPRTPTERALVTEIFAPLLGLPEVGIHDNFFELGGNSLQSAQLMSKIRRRFEVEVTLADFFRAPTVANLALLVDRQRIGRLSDEELVELLDSMPEEEVARLLGNDTGGGEAA